MITHDAVACCGDECGVAASKQSLYVYFSLDGMTSQLVPNQLQLTRIMGLLNPQGWGHIVLGREAQRVSRLLEVEGPSRRQGGVAWVQWPRARKGS